MTGQMRPARGSRGLFVLAGAAGLVLALIAFLLWWAAKIPPPGLASLPQAECSATAPPSGRVFFVDPERGTADGDGSRERPWKDLQALVDQGMLGEYKRTVPLTGRWLARFRRSAPTADREDRPGAIIRSGDTILLASGHYGTLDLSGLGNSGFVKIAAAPGATPQLSGLIAAGASHFWFDNLIISSPSRPRSGARLLSTYDIDQPRADNLVFDRLAISGARPIATADPGEFSRTAPSGAVLFGDCLTFSNSTFHDLENAINIVRSRDVVAENNTIRDFSIDAVQFSGIRLAIRNNRIFDHWRTPNRRHPDCMQGQPYPGQQFGPISITGNVCISRLARGQPDPVGAPETAKTGLQGIVIFDGLWRDVIVRCNLLMPNNPHGIALYGVDHARVEHNVVVGAQHQPYSWIAIMPSKDGRQPEDAIVRGNVATGYLNAVHGSTISPDAMIGVMKAKRSDEALMRALREPSRGVRLDANLWLLAQADAGYPLDDARFTWKTAPPVHAPRDTDEALERFALPEACDAGA